MNLREQQAQQTYDKIMLTAQRLLESCTFEELSVDQICHEAGISKGGFYHHFPSKDQLVSILIGQQLGNRIAESVAPMLGKRSAPELLKIYVDTMAAYLEDSPGNTLARCWLAMAEHPERTDGVFSVASFQVLHEIVAQGKAEGSIRPELEQKFCESFLNGALTGIMLYGATFRNHLQIKPFAEASLELIYQTISQ